MRERTLAPEILDELPANDPRAIQSRRDLQKVNTFMGHTAILTRAMRAAGKAPGVVVELGSGDGTLLLRVAKRLGRPHTRVRAVLVDRRPSVSRETHAGFREIGWEIETAPADVFDWLLRPTASTVDVTLANLFLHHFRDGQLAALLTAAARQTRHFIACEPLRSRTSLAGASLLPLIGCNEVTVHDGKISVRAGFRDRELSALWPRESGWHLAESRAGLFTHLFVASARMPS